MAVRTSGDILSANTCLSLWLTMQLYKKWARRVPNWGKVLSQLGQGACPMWARMLSIFYLKPK